QDVRLKRLNALASGASRGLNRFRHAGDVIILPGGLNDESRGSKGRRYGDLRNGAPSGLGLRVDGAPGGWVRRTNTNSVAVAHATGPAVPRECAARRIHQV